MNVLRRRCDHRNDFLFPIEIQFNKLIDDFFNKNEIKSFKDSVKSTMGYPKLDILEDDEHLVIKVAVPGMKLDNLQVEVENVPETGSPTLGHQHRIKGYKTVSISGKMAQEHSPPDEEVHYYVRELRHSQFNRVIQLPDNVEGDPEAELKEGILTLRWKLATPEPPPKPPKKVIEIREG